MIPDKELYVSIDVEADGPIPGMNSMLSFGSAVFDINGNLWNTFECNLELLPEATSEVKTMEWWKTQPEAWEHCRKDLLSPSVVMNSYYVNMVHLSEQLNKKLVCIGYPITYDFMFLYWYLMKFAGKSPFSFSGIDIKTIAMMMMKRPYTKIGKSSMPKRWFEGAEKHTHTPLEDAKGQGRMFVNMAREFFSGMVF